MDIDAIVKNLNNRRFIAKRFATAKEATAEMLSVIGAQSVGIGGSSSVNSTGIYDTLRAQGNTVHCHTFVPKEEKDAVRRAAFDADVYLCSANAITESGVIVNIDGTGNRVAATIFGSPTVIMLVGKNKLVDSIEDGIARTKRDCCPQNAKRQGFPTPCAITGVCNECTGPARMCNVTILHEYPTRHTKNFYVFLVDEDLGY